MFSERVFRWAIFHVLSCSGSLQPSPRILAHILKSVTASFRLLRGLWVGKKYAWGAWINFLDVVCTQKFLVMDEVTGHASEWLGCRHLCNIARCHARFSRLNSSFARLRIIRSGVSDLPNTRRYHTYRFRRTDRFSGSHFRRSDYTHFSCRIGCLGTGCLWTIALDFWARLSRVQLLSRPSIRRIQSRSVWDILVMPLRTMSNCGLYGCTCVVVHLFVPSEWTWSYCYA